MNRLRHTDDKRFDRGMTLLELMMALAIMTIVMGMLFGLSVGMSDSSRVREQKAKTMDEARRAMLSIERELRQVQLSSLTGVPGRTISYRIAADVDGNGTAVDRSGRLETVGPRTIGRDTTDANRDGLMTSQLVLTGGAVPLVLANDLLVDEDVNSNGLLDAGEDTNRNGVLDHGVWFQSDGNGVRVTIQTRGRSRRGAPVLSTLSETIRPRN